MEYMCGDFGVNSLGHFPFRALTDRETDSHTDPADRWVE